MVDFIRDFFYEPVNIYGKGEPIGGTEENRFKVWCLSIVQCGNVTVVENGSGVA